MIASFSDTAARLTALAYLFTAAACALASVYRTADHESLNQCRQIWQNFAIVLSLIAVNTLVGGEQVLVLWLRSVARADGWYEIRRPVQVVVLAIALGAGVLLAARLWNCASLSNPPMALAWATAGIGVVMGLVCLRLVSYHYADVLMGHRVAGFSLARWTELFGFVLVWLGALQQLLFTYSFR